MKYILLLTIFITSQVKALPGFWCPSTNEIYRAPKAGLDCYAVPDGFDVDVGAVVGGVAVVDAVKKAAKDAAQATKKAQLEASVAKVTACESLYSTVDSVNTLVDMKALLKCLVRDAR